MICSRLTSELYKDIINVFTKSEDIEWVKLAKMTKKGLIFTAEIDKEGQKKRL